MDAAVRWAKRVWSAWASGVVPEEVDERITAVHQGVRDLTGFLTRPGPVVLFVEGGRGEGKSHLLRWAVAEARKKGQRAAYVLYAAGARWERGRGLLLGGLEGWGVRLQEVAWPEADMWFKLARLARERFPDRFPPKERNFIYRLGVYAERGWPVSDAQRKWAEQVVAEAVVCDAIPELTDSFRMGVMVRCGSCPVWAIDDPDAALGSTGAWGVLATLRGIAELVACGRLPFRLILAVTPELRAILGAELILGNQNVTVVSLPAVNAEEAASVVRVVNSVFEVATGRSHRVDDRQVHEWLRKYPKRRELIQAVVQSLERAARA